MSAGGSANLLCRHFAEVSPLPALYSAVESALLARYVTNLDEDVYAIVNLPEEVVAVVFGYVSRSPRSFRDNLLRLLQEGSLAMNVPAGLVPETALAAATQKAAAFHERWVIGYGHSSVAEHAVAHVGVENISRLASAELELANAFLSFTEYSQRYQKPQRGRYFCPDGLPAATAAAYQATMDWLYDAYEALYTGLTAFLEKTDPPVAGETSQQRQSRLAKKAFEDARYALPLATLTNLGLTGNGRALRDALAVLGASTAPEVRRLAADIETEAEKVLPTLLRHTAPTAHQLQWRAAQPAPSAASVPMSGRAMGPEARLLWFTGQHHPEPEAAAIDVLAGVMSAAPGPVPSAEAYLAAGLTALGPHDMLPEAFCWITYDAFMQISEANWHQLLRHCRGMRFQAGPPEIANGYTVPPNVEAAGLESLLAAAITQAERLYEELRQVAPASVAGYAVINAHRRRVRTTFDLRQLYHLANLRLSPEAQWDIRDAVGQLFRQISAVHPRLCRAAQRR